MATQTAALRRRLIESGGSSTLKGIFCPEQGVVECASERLKSQIAQLLHERLFRAALILAGAIGISAFWERLMRGGLGWEPLLAFLIAAGAAGYLHLSEKVRLSTLRLLELALFGSALFLLSSVYLPRIVSGPESEAAFQFYRAALGVFGLMVAYGLFIPNPLLRAAAVLSSMLLLPPLLTWVGVLFDPDLGEAIRGRLGGGHLAYGGLMLGLAVLVSAYGSHLLFTLRRDGARMQEMGMYQLKEKIGAGGMGEVWKAEHRLLSRPAAIKVVRPDISQSGGREGRSAVISRFRREARITASLRSPHTVELYDFGLTGEDTFYFVMEYLEGLNLEELVDRFGPQPPERVVYLLRQAAESLAEAHQAGLVHRDIKPSNLHVGRAGVRDDFLKVLDFGLVAFTQNGHGDSRLTMEGATTGTPAFMAPEMALGKGGLDERTDIYALGCVAYWLLTGRMVFDGDTPMEILVQHVKSEPLPPSQRSELSIPGCLDDIVLRMLQKDPALRPGSMARLSRELDGCGLAAHWTAEKARTWWRSHLPEIRSTVEDQARELDEGQPLQKT